MNQWYALILIIFSPIPIKLKVILFYTFIGYVTYLWLTKQFPELKRTFDLKIKYPIENLLRRYSLFQRSYNALLDFPTLFRNIYLQIGIGLIVSGLWLVKGLVIVNLNEQAAIIRFGKIVRTLSPGLHLYMPWPIEEVVKTDITLHKITSADLSEYNKEDSMLVMTKDENMLSVEFTIFWRVRDIARYLFRAQAPDSLVESGAETIMRSIMAETLAQEALTVGRQELADQVKEKLQQLMDDDEVGIDIVDAQMGKIDPPNSVIDSYREVLKAKLEQETQKNEAESYANYVIPKAEGQAFTIITDAKVKIASILNETRGNLEGLQAQLKIFEGNPVLADQIMYTDMMTKILGNAKVRLIPKNANLVPYVLNNSNLTNSQTAKPTNLGENK